MYSWWPNLHRKGTLMIILQPKPGFGTYSDPKTFLLKPKSTLMMFLIVTGPICSYSTTIQLQSCTVGIPTRWSTCFCHSWRHQGCWRTNRCRKVNLYNFKIYFKESFLTAFEPETLWVLCPDLPSFEKNIDKREKETEKWIS